jgi:hypothetical protein
VFHHHPVNTTFPPARKPHQNRRKLHMYISTTAL